MSIFGNLFFLPSCVGNRNGEVQLIDVYLADWDGRGELQGWWETDFRSWAHRWFNAAPSCLFSHSHICFAWPTIELSPFICFQAESSTWKMCLSCQRRAAAHRFLLENTNQNSYSDTLDTFYSCRFSLVKSLLLLILGGFFFFSHFCFWTIIKNVHAAQSTSRMWGCSTWWLQCSFSPNVCQMCSVPQTLREPQNRVPPTGNSRHYTRKGTRLLSSLTQTDDGSTACWWCWNSLFFVVVVPLIVSFWPGLCTSEDDLCVKIFT